LNMYYESGADSSFNIHICKEWLLSLFSGERVRWFRKDFDNPYDAWVKRQIG